MKTIIKVAIFILFLSSQTVFGQWFKKEIDTRIVNIDSKQKSIKASIVSDIDKKIPSKNEFVYCWYIDKTIKETQGGFDGKLLHGDYKEFYPDNGLICKGQYSLGLKEGVWKYWKSNGNLEKIETWKKGKLHGYYCSYNPDGKKMFELKFKNGQKNGQVIHYKDGEEIIKKENYKSGLLNGKQYIQVENKLTNYKTFRKGKPIIKQKNDDELKEKKQKRNKEKVEKKDKSKEKSNPERIDKQKKTKKDHKKKKKSEKPIVKLNFLKKPTGENKNK